MDGQRGRICDCQRWIKIEQAVAVGVVLWLASTHILLFRKTRRVHLFSILKVLHEAVSKKGSAIYSHTNCYLPCLIRDFLLFPLDTSRQQTKKNRRGQFHYDYG